MHRLYRRMNKRNRHQVKAVLTRPTKSILVPTCADPNRRPWPLHRLRQNTYIVVVKKLAAKVHRVVGPGLADDFGCLFRAARSFFLAQTQSPVLNRLTSLADAEI